MIPAVPPAAYDAARHRAALIDRSGRGRIVVSGADRAAYLQGLLTNDVVALKAGQGCYAAYLTAQGRMIADLHVYELGDVMLLTMAGDVKDGVLAKLDQFIFTEDVQLGDATDTFAQIAVVGPRAAQAIAGVVTGLSAERLRDLAEHGNLRAPWGGGTAIVARVTDTGEPGYDVYVEREDAGAEPADRARVRAPRFRRARNEADSRRRERGSHDAAVRHCRDGLTASARATAVRRSFTRRRKTVPYRRVQIQPRRHESQRR